MASKPCVKYIQNFSKGTNTTFSISGLIGWFYCIIDLGKSETLGQGTLFVICSSRTRIYLMSSLEIDAEVLRWVSALQILRVAKGLVWLEEC